MPCGIWINIRLHSCGVAKASVRHGEHTAQSKVGLFPWSLLWEAGKRHSSPSSRSLGRVRRNIMLSASELSLKMGERWTTTRGLVMGPLCSDARVCSSFWPECERATDHTFEHLHQCWKLWNFLPWRAAVERASRQV